MRPTENRLPVIATLHLPVFTTKRAKPWLGWNIVFESYVKEELMLREIPSIEFSLNKYLQKNVDVTANHLVVPFNCKMRATVIPRVYSFKIKVYAKLKLRRKELFSYPSEPVNSINGFLLLMSFPGTSHVSTVSIKPPPN